MSRMDVFICAGVEAETFDSLFLDSKRLQLLLIGIVHFDESYDFPVRYSGYSGLEERFKLTLQCSSLSFPGFAGAL